MTTDQLLAELEAMLAARKERKMGDYKVVPVVSTSEMDIAGTESGAGIELNRHDAELVWSAMIAAAPAVQGEPDVPALAEVLTSDLSARINRVSKRSLDGSVVMYSEEWNGIVELVKKLLIAAPQPAEQQPTRRKKPMAYPNGLDMEAMPGMVGHQQPTPDELSDYGRGFRDGKLDRLIDEVLAESALVEALQNMLGAFDTPIIRRKVGSVFSEEAIASAHAALAAHRKGGE